jgi:hypothetical protein
MPAVLGAQEIMGVLPGLDGMCVHGRLSRVLLTAACR